MKKVFVGLSGGVDSSVSALLLKKAGFHVTGVFIKAWHPDFLPCNWRSDMRDAMRICAKLEIPFLMCDLEKEYKKEVIDYLISEYALGRTPNPDVFCNKFIKFGSFLDFAENNGADFIATGHYAIKKEKGNGKVGLFNSLDTEKDQTYFLWTISQNKLVKVLFPIGHLPKKEVRRIAEKNNLHTHSKKDSQGLCFIGHVDIKTFLKRFIKTKSGKVLNETGEEIGIHEGSELYTIGQRHGFKIFNEKNDSVPYYILSKNINENTITVTDKEKTNNLVKKIALSDLNFIDIEIFNENIFANIRYHGELHPGKISKEGDYLFFVFEKPIEIISPGQSIVFYKDAECLGGAIVQNIML